MTTPAFLVVAAATMFDAAAVHRLLFRPRGAVIGLDRVAWTAALLTSLVLVQLAVAVAVVRSWFLAIALAYAVLMLLVPAAGIALLVASRHRPVAGSVRALAWGSTLLLPVFVYATFVEPYRLVTERVDVPIDSARALPRPLVVGVLADIQCVDVGDHEREAVRRIMEARPDLVLLPGDLQQAGFDRRHEIGPKLRDLLAPLRAPLGVWYVEGNTEDAAQARWLLEGTGVRVLVDEIVDLEHDGVRVRLCGVGLSVTPRSRAVLERMEWNPDEQSVRVVMAHAPDVIQSLPGDSRVELVVAGHTHGGQVRLPFFGPLITLSGVPRAVAAGGLHELGGRRIYVSRGIGWEHGHAPRVRFLCPPEVTLLHLARSGRAP